jgi:hypothetical protein
MMDSPVQRCCWYDGQAETECVSICLVMCPKVYKDLGSISSPLQSVIHIVVMSVYKTTPNNSSICPYRMLVVIMLCVLD